MPYFRRCLNLRCVVFFLMFLSCECFTNILPQLETSLYWKYHYNVLIHIALWSHGNRTKLRGNLNSSFVLSSKWRYNFAIIIYLVCALGLSGLNCHMLLCGAKELICFKEFYKLSFLSKSEIALELQKKGKPS